MPFEVKTRHNREYKGGTNSPRFFFDLDLSSILPRQARSTVPVYWGPNNTSHPTLKELYWTEIAGVRLEKGNLMALERAVPEAISSMVSFGTFPYYFFILPGGERIPAYYSEGKLRLKLPEGALLTGDEAGELWQKLSAHFHAHRRLSSQEQVEVSLLLWKDLRLYPTAMVLRDGKEWIPIFYFRDEVKLLYDTIGVPTRFLGVDAAFELRREVAQSLAGGRAISSPLDLAIDRLNGEVWKRMATIASPTGFALSYFSRDGQRVELPLYGVMGEVFALEHQSRPRLLFSASVEEAQQRVAAALKREGKLPSGFTLNLERVEG